MTIDQKIREELRRIADALERLSPETSAPLTPEKGDAFIWNANHSSLKLVPNVNRVDLSLLCGIEHSKRILLENTERFGRGLPANNALLWGARGMGKSSLIKAVHKQVADQIPIQ